jgi:hypothetical protein
MYQKQFRQLRRVLPPRLATRLAAGIGMVLCYEGLWWTWLKFTVRPSSVAATKPSIDRYTMTAAPFLIGAVTAAAAYAVYMLLIRRDDIREHVAEGLAKFGARLTRLTPTVQRVASPRAPTGARAMFYYIVGGSAMIGGLLAGLLYSFGADGLRSDGTGETVGATFAGAIQGAMVGLAFGLVLAVPTAIIVWFLGRGRR